MFTNKDIEFTQHIFPG